MFVFVKIWGCHGNRLRAGLAVCMPLTEAWTSTSLTGHCGRIVTLSDENRRTSGVRSPDEHSNKSRTTSCRSGSSCAVWVSSGGTGFPTIGSTWCRVCRTAACGAHDSYTPPSPPRYTLLKLLSLSSGTRVPCRTAPLPTPVHFILACCRPPPGCGSSSSIVPRSFSSTCIYSSVVFSSDIGCVQLWLVFD